MKVRTMSKVSESILNKLVEELDDATNLYLQGMSDNSGDSGLAGVQVALNSVFKYCQSIGVPHQSLRPLLGLRAALDDVSKGVKTDLLQPNLTGRKPPKTFQHKQVRVTAAACMELYMQGGSNRKNAAKKVADKLISLRVNLHRSIRSGNRQGAWSTVARWRSEFKEGHHDDIYVKSYQNLIKQALEVLIDDPNLAADQLLGNLPSNFNLTD